MKLYKTDAGIFIAADGNFYHVDEDWDSYINDDQLHEKMTAAVQEARGSEKEKSSVQAELQAPIGSQELWASGVTYLRSKQGRQEESALAGGEDFYQRVYDAERPELFFKAAGHRIVGHGEKVRIRRDSTWNVPEPELTLVLTSNQKIVAYTIGNDMSSRSIEGANPLYLPQAKTYDKCAALGPCLYVTEEKLPKDTKISMKIHRKGECIFKDSVEILKMKRGLDELVSFLYRECSFPRGCYLMTGTGIVPASGFTLHVDDEIQITIDSIGTLSNSVE